MSLRAFASETAIYGLSSILGRALYFLLVPLYTGIFSDVEFGVQTDVFTIIGFLMVLATLRLDVAFFRFHDREPEANLLGTTWLTTGALAGVFGLLLLGLSPKLASWFGYPQYQWLIALGGGILFFDALVEIPLAKLRMEQRAWRFALVRLTGICINLGLNLFWLVLLPKWSTAPAWLSTSFSGIGYIFLANLIASALVFLLLAKELRGMRWQIDWTLLRRLFAFSLPLVIVGFSYIINELLDRKLLPLLWPGGTEEGLGLLGVYGANYKLAMLLALFTQAFRYGAEPFFFRESQSADAKEKYARVAHYYLIAALLGVLVVNLFLPALAQFFLRDESYRSGVAVVPILLLANLCLGMYYNFSVWYKVTDRTRFGAYISVGGALITIVLNVLLIPRFGFYGCAVATLVCYASMCVAAVWFGRKHYPIAYPWRRMMNYVSIGGLLWYGYSRFAPIICGWLGYDSKTSYSLAQEGGELGVWSVHLSLAVILTALFVLQIYLEERKAQSPTPSA